MGYGILGAPTMKTIMKGLFAAGVMAIVAVASPADLVGQRSGVEIWSQNCGSCHMIQPANRYTAGKWESIMMHMRIAARMTDDEANAVLEFLRGGAKPLASEEQADEPEVLAHLASGDPRAAWTTVPDGAELYGRECVACHGDTGLGDGPVANALNPRPVDLTESVFKTASDDQLAEMIAGGKDTMPGFGERLSSDQIAALVRYVRELQAR
jgi:mono/diheme cytochrome c family protein